MTVIERARAQRGSSLGNAGMIVPSHFMPLAAPGMVRLGSLEINSDFPAADGTRRGFNIGGLHGAGRSCRARIGEGIAAPQVAGG